MGRQLLTDFLKSCDGNFAMLSAVLALPVLAAASLVIDTTAAHLESTKLQESLDAASLGSLRTFADTRDASSAERAGQGFFRASFQKQFATPELAADGGFAMHLAITSDSTAETAEATATLRYEPMLLSWLGFDINRTSVAIRNKPMENCILALHPSKSRSFTVNGSSQVDLKECTVVANSRSEQAIYIGGSSQFKGKCLITHGAVALNSAADLDCEAPITRAEVVEDPYAHKQTPRAGDYPPRLVPPGDEVALLPGTYRGLKLDGTALLAPGNYIIDGGKLNFAAGANVVAKGVTFFLINGAELDIHGKALVQASPSTTGAWAGFLFVADQGNTKRAVINGSSGSSMSGIVYLPSARELHFSGGGGTGGGCVRLIAQEITMIGNSKFSIDCSNELAGNIVRTGGSIRLAR
nr:pilus assembly protein [arsenite-oxidising bacterium NT-25]